MSFSIGDRVRHHEYGKGEIIPQQNGEAVQLGEVRVVFDGEEDADHDFRSLPVSRVFPV